MILLKDLKLDNLIIPYIIFKIIIFLSAITLVVFLFPREGKFKYEFQKNKTWAHQDLYSPFDFAILKSDLEIEKEKSNIQSSHLLYFSRTLDIEKKSINEFKLKLNRIIDENSVNKLNKETFQNLGTKILNKIYEIGVYSPSEELINTSENHRVLLLNEQNIGEEFEFSDLLTKQKALDIITQIDTTLLHLVKSCLQENIVYDSKLTNEQLISDLKTISSTRGGILNGQKIITTGEIINEEKFLILESLKNEYENKLGSNTSFIWILFGQFIIISILFYTLFLFLKNVSNKVFYENKDIIFLGLVIIGFLLLTILVLKFSSLNVSHKF